MTLHLNIPEEPYINSSTTKFFMKQIIRYDDFDNKSKSISNKYHANSFDDCKIKSDKSLNIHRICSELENSIPTFISEPLNPLLSFCSTKESICSTVESLDSISKRKDKKKFETSYHRQYEYYDDKFIKTTLEKHARLQNIVKKLVLARKYEKEKEKFNKNDLRINKVRSDNSLHIRDENVEYINDCSISSFVENVESNENESQSSINSSTRSQKYSSDYHCYPMSSQGRFMMLTKNRKKSFEWQNHPVNRPIYVSNLKVDSPRPLRRKTLAYNKACCACDSLRKTIQNSCIQTDSTEFCVKCGSNKKEDDSSLEDGQTQVSKISVNASKEVDKNILKNIEHKLDSLITSFNHFKNESKLKSEDDKHCYCRSSTYPRKYSQYNVSSVESSELLRAEELVCNILADKAKEQSRSQGIHKKSYETRSTDIHNVLIEEIDSSNKAKQDIENILRGSHYASSFQMYEIPTKEIYTEIKDSLSTSKDFLSTPKAQVLRSEDGRSTIAVNTDPLGLFALLKVSTESARQLLSFMSNIARYPYPMVTQAPRITERVDYVCNVCGKTFERPLQLSDHIQRCHLAGSRDCCECRHILDMQSRRMPRMFQCQYCGKQFTRAYCCEFHQESCARRHGIQHDVNPSLIILK